MKHLFFICTLLLSTILSAQNTESIYQFTVTDIEGNEFSFEQLQNKKVMIVNTASKCGLTPQYEDLQALYEEFGGDDFMIIGFPANNFMKQEPGTDEEIQAFCSKNYGVTFPMMSKIDVKGNEIHPLYEYLTTAALNGHSDNKVQWNFQKYLINENGFLEKVISPKTKPLDPEITTWIKGE